MAKSNTLNTVFYDRMMMNEFIDKTNASHQYLTNFTVNDAQVAYSTNIKPTQNQIRVMENEAAMRDKKWVIMDRLKAKLRAKNKKIESNSNSISIQ